jgi:hypothetical protein
MPFKKDYIYLAAFYLARLLYVRPETFGPYYVFVINQPMHIWTNFIYWSNLLLSYFKNVKKVKVSRNRLEIPEQGG